jgi:hypothetical protein
MPNGNMRVFAPHQRELRESGLTDETVCAAGIRSLDRKREADEITKTLRWGRPYEGRYGDCWVIPYPNPDGTPSGYARLKFSKPRAGEDKKTGERKTVKYEAPKGVPNRAYFPPRTLPVLQDPAVPLLVTEGEKKALKADQEGFPTVGLSGVWAWQRKREKNKDGLPAGPRDLIPDLGAIPWEGRRVFVVFDSDAATNKNVQEAERHFAKALVDRGATVKIVRLPPGPPDKGGRPGKVGLDDYFVAGHSAADFRQLLEVATDPEPPPRQSPRPGNPGDARPVIVITTDEHTVNAKAADALGRDADIYQRGGQLVRVARDLSPAGRGIRRPCAPRIDTLPLPIVRERLAATVQWFSRRSGEFVPAHPPEWAVRAIHARGEWPGVRHLEAVIEYPVLRPDGTLLMTPGYDSTTGLLLEPRGELPELVESPTRADARGALGALLDVVDDFPFERPAHRAAWVAALLTPLARFAFEGAAPLFLVDANVRGAGKGLLLDVISRIVTGERFTVATYTNDEDELRKRITALAIAGDRLVLFDNLDGRFGGAALDAALTATAWRDRVLGESKMVEAPLYMTWFATGNNVAVHADTARRLCPIRIERPEERPEELTGFRYPELLKHVADNRGRLLAAALTILRAYFVAGRPPQPMRTWGSYENWSAVVRGAVIWAGLPDPAEARLELQQQSDTVAEGMTALLAGWAKLDPGRRGLTAAEVIAALFTPRPASADPLPDWLGDMRAAVEALVGRADSRALGYKLRNYRRRVFGGLYLDRASTARKTARWAAFPASAFRTNSQAGGGDGGDGGDVYPNPSVCAREDKEIF